MLGRALSLATVTILIGCLTAGSAHAQATNLEAGKSPSQIFAGTCSACHKSPRGLLKTVGASSLPGFLRQHYTTSSDMASVLASFLVSNGATDTRYQAKQDQAKQGKDAKQEAARPSGPSDQLDRFGRRVHSPPAQDAAKPDSQEQAARPDADGLGPQGEGGRPGRNAKRQSRPGEAPDATNPQAATEPRLGARQKLSKRGKPGEDLVKPDAAKPDAVKPDAVKPDAPKGETPKDDTSPGETAKVDTKTEPAKPDDAKSEDDKPEGTKPAAEDKSETAKVDAPKETGGGEPTPLRPDPVPPVTPAPAMPPAPSASPAASSTAEPAASPPAAETPPAASPAPPAVTAAAPPPPVASAGPPAPPISK